MKFTILFSMIVLFQVQANPGYSQRTKISLELEEVDFIKVFEEIESKTEFSFFYKNEDIDITKKISINVTNKKIELILNKIFQDTDISYTLLDRQIIIKKKLPDDIVKGSAKSNVPEAITLKEIEVSGAVKDINGEPLPGVNIVIKGTVTGTVSDMDGNFKLAVPDESSILVFSYIGYETQEVLVGTNAVINVEMIPDLTSLDEIVVVGYGTVKKKDLTGAVVALSEEDMTTGGNVASAAQMLQGRAAGVEVTTNSAQPGASMSIIIRGAGSILNGTEPLYVVDGFPIDGGVTLNPNDIERIDILKDASAAAIYGSRASSGVVLITTKKGKKGKVSVNYSGYSGVQKIQNDQEMLKWKEYYTLRNNQWDEIPGNSGGEFTSNDIATTTALVGDEGTDWYGLGTRSAGIQNHQVTATAGDENSSFLLSGNYFNQQGVMLNSDFNRGSVRLNVDRKIGKVKVGANVYAQQLKRNATASGAGSSYNSTLYQLLTTIPGLPHKDANGNYINDFRFDNSPSINRINPIGRAEETTNEYAELRGYVNLWADYEIIEGLVAHVNIGVDKTNGTSTDFEPAIYSSSRTQSAAAIEEYKSTTTLLEGTLKYTTQISSSQTLEILVGASNQYFDNFSFAAYGVGFATDKTLYYNLGSAAVQNISSARADSRLISFFSRANYTLNDKYLLTVSFRRDGASILGTNNKWGTLPSISGAWRISEENFLSGLNIVSDLKLRLGFGVTGNQNFDPYTSLARVGTGEFLTLDGNTVLSGINPVDGIAPNPNLRWETTEMLNVGLDFGFFKNRLTGSFEYYNSNTKDLIIPKRMPPSTSYSVQVANVGEVNNTGIELMLSGDILVEEFKWTLSANFSKNTNQVTKLDGDTPISRRVARRPTETARADIYTQLEPGGAIGDFYGYVFDGVLQPGEVRADQPATVVAGSALYKDINGDGAITEEDRTIIGNAMPDFIYGFNNRFSYKGFSLDVFFQGSQGNDLLNLRRLYLGEFSTPDARERYSAANPDGRLPGNGYFYDGTYGSYINSEFVEDASYLRLKNLVFAYDFNTNNIKWLSNLGLFISGQNLITFTKYSGFDPEVNFYGRGGFGRGVDDNGYPNIRTFTGGIKLGF